MSEKKDFFDSIDDFFTQLNAEEASKHIQKGFDKFNEVPNKINDAIKNKGYDNVSEFFQGEFSDKKREKPKIRPKRLRDFESRAAFVEDALKNIHYDLKYRGYFKEGHEQAIQYILSLLPQYPHDLDRLAKRIQLEKSEIKQNQPQKKDAYTNGYLHGYDTALKAIQQSKTVIMRQILTEMNP